MTKNAFKNLEPNLAGIKYRNESKSDKRISQFNDRNNRYHGSTSKRRTLSINTVKLHTSPSCLGGFLRILGSSSRRNSSINSSDNTKGNILDVSSRLATQWTFLKVIFPWFSTVHSTNTENLKEFPNAIKY